MPRLSRTVVLRAVTLIAASTAGEGRAIAHPGEPLAPHDVIWAWSAEPWVLVPLLGTAWFYAVGVRRWLRRRPQAQLSGVHWSFIWGWLALAVALLSPLDALGGVLFSAHMAQHELLMLGAAPLLVYARPFTWIALGLPRGVGRVARPLVRPPVVRAVWRRVTTPFTAWVLHGLVIWVWHTPALFEATLTSELIHILQHTSFFASAVLFWWAVFQRARPERHYGMAFLYVFGTAVHTTVLGALLVISGTVWYPAYAVSIETWGLTALEDQQLGGLIMWVPAGLGYGATALWLFARWLQAASRPRVMATLSTLLSVCVLAQCSRGQPMPVQIAGADLQRGEEALREYGCSTCHTIPGVAGARGRVGPSLDGVASRMYIAGDLPNTPSQLMQWIADPPALRPDTVMPVTGVSDDDLRHIAAYLSRLQ